MKAVTKLLILGICVCIFSTLTAAQKTAEEKTSSFDADLAKKLGADKYGMKHYILVILKTGPKDTNFKGKERDEIFAGHFANIGRLADAGKLAIAGPFDNNDKGYRGVFVFNVATVEEAQKLVETDPAFKAGVFIADMTPWYCSAALMQVNETHKKIAAKSF